MCQYSAVDGIPGEYHLAHLGRFALGGFGLVILEAAAVAPEGRISPFDLGIWGDEHIEPLSRIVDLVHELGAKVGIQLAHAGPKGSARRPWDGGGPIDSGEGDIANGLTPWQTVSAGSEPPGPGWPAPEQLDADGIERLKIDYAAAALRAERSGFDLVEIHGAHGYLLNTFSSPLSNHRDDIYGDDPMLLPEEIAELVREAWPSDKPLSYRVSAVDAADPANAEGAVDIDYTVEFAARLKRTGVDLVDCSSGGVGGTYSHPIGPGYQVPYAAAVREGATIPTVAVGLITEPEQAEAIIADGKADLVALAREALYNPNWPLHARLALEGDAADFSDWPKQAGSRLAARRGKP